MNKILSTLVIISPLVAIALANPALAGENPNENTVNTIESAKPLEQGVEFHPISTSTNTHRSDTDEVALQQDVSKSPHPLKISSSQSQNISVASSPDLPETMVNPNLIAQGTPDSTSKKNYIGPSIGFFSDASVYGLSSRIGVSDNISVRPFIQFGSASNGAVSANLTLYGGTVTYDLNISKSDFTPYAGVGLLGVSGTVSAGTASASGSASQFLFEVGTDYNISDSIALNASYKFSNSGYLSVVGGYRF